MAKKPLFKFLLFLFLLHSTAFAFHPRKAGESDFFLHPFAMTSGIIDRSFDLNFYVTALIPLGEYKHYNLIINPSLLDRSDYFRLGSGLGIRSFIYNNMYYLQLMPGAYYFRETISGPMIDVLGYIGFNLGLFFFDAGMGYSWNFAKERYGLVFDANFGFNFILGFPSLLLLPIYAIF